ncbi:hypothetical protein [Halioglobus japonicus]|uniref:hypothetical protein n=1 Tax=Halioglobus japonicus TaxID=930805 RepID=UPI0012F4B010|nr:hypothetical protein [Halioglobus japonicus]
MSKSNAPAEPTELIPAATVLLLRDGADGVEKLMRKNSRIVFRGFWVFPGGRIDPEDGSDQDAIQERPGLLRPERRWRRPRWMSRLMKAGLLRQLRSLYCKLSMK